MTVVEYRRPCVIIHDCMANSKMNDTFRTLKQDSGGHERRTTGRYLGSSIILHDTSYMTDVESIPSQAISRCVHLKYH